MDHRNSIHALIIHGPFDHAKRPSRANICQTIDLIVDDRLNAIIRSKVSKQAFRIAMRMSHQNERNEHLK